MGDIGGPSAAATRRISLMPRPKIDPYIIYADVMSVWFMAHAEYMKGNPSPVLTADFENQAKAVFFVHRMHRARAAAARFDNNVSHPWYGMTLSRTGNTVFINRRKQMDNTVKWRDNRGNEISEETIMTAGMMEADRTIGKSQDMAKINKMMENINHEYKPKHDGRPTLDEVMEDDE
jgi:hypothetical protein